MNFLDGVLAGLLIALFLKIIFAAVNAAIKIEEPEPIEYEEVPVPMPFDERELRYARIKPMIQRLYATAGQIDETEELLASIDRCSPGQTTTYMHLAFRPTDAATNQQNRSVEFAVDGASESSDEMRTLAEAKRRELRTSLLNQIIRLHANVVTETVPKTIITTRYSGRGGG